MTKEDSLKIISHLSTIIGLLEHKWGRPQSHLEATVMQMLLDIRETVRKDHEAAESEAQA